MADQLGVALICEKLKAIAMHALIIEDEILIALALEDMLADLGYNSFDIAVTEDEAITAAARHRPDLITSDVQLLAGSGIDAVQTICPDRAIPVVFITSNAGQVRERSAAAVVIDKPIELKALRRSIEAARSQLISPNAFKRH